MKANGALEKIYFDGENRACKLPVFSSQNIEYIRTDAFIELALKWYCLDCECNDNCKDTKCFFYRQYERYLKGDKNSIPPKFSDSILNEDGSTSDNWVHRHFIAKMRDAFIEKACDWIKSMWSETDNRFKEDYTGMLIEDFRKYMEGE